MRRFNAVIMTVGLVYSLCVAPAGAADQKTFVMGYDPTGPTCHLGQYAVLVKGFFAEEGLRVKLAGPPRREDRRLDLVHAEQFDQPPDADPAAELAFRQLHRRLVEIDG